MANTKISAFTAENDVANITGFAAFKTVGGSSTNVKISGSEIESTLNLSNFAVGTLAVGRGGTGATTFTANGILIGNTASAISATAELADGQLLIGHTGNAPVAATLTQGTDLSITNGNGSISIGHAAVGNTPGSNSTTLSAGGTFTAINSVTVSAQGHLTAQNTETYTLPSDTDTSIYAADGSLTGARIVTMGSNNLTFASTTAGQEVKFEQNVRIDGQSYTSLETISSTTSWTPDWDSGNVQTMELGGTTTINNPSNIEVGATYIIILKQDSEGTHTVSWGSQYKFPAGNPPTITTTANKADVITLIAYSSTVLMCTSVQDFATS